MNLNVNKLHKIKFNSLSRLHDKWLCVSAMIFEKFSREWYDFERRMDFFRRGSNRITLFSVNTVEFDQNLADCFFFSPSTIVKKIVFS